MKKHKQWIKSADVKILLAYSKNFGWLSLDDS